MSKTRRRNARALCLSERSDWGGEGRGGDGRGEEMVGLAGRCKYLRILSW